MGLALWGIYVSNFRKLSILALYGPRPWIIQVVLTIGLNKPIYNLHYRASSDESKNSYYDCFAVCGSRGRIETTRGLRNWFSRLSEWLSDQCKHVLTGMRWWVLEHGRPGDGAGRGGGGGGSSCPVIRWTKQDNCLVFPRSERWHRTTFIISFQ